jgi:hypothetical protein
MWHSIQENLKIINSRLSVFDCISLGATALLFCGFVLFLDIQKEAIRKPVLYIPSNGQNQAVLAAPRDSRPFGSKSGTTYTFFWCQGSAQIKESNKIYFASEDAAKAQGRTLSKLCQK